MVKSPFLQKCGIGIYINMLLLCSSHYFRDWLQTGENLLLTVAAHLPRYDNSGVILLLVYWQFSSRVS